MSPVRISFRRPGSPPHEIIALRGDAASVDLLIAALNVLADERLDDTFVARAKTTPVTIPERIDDDDSLIFVGEQSIPGERTLLTPWLARLRTLAPRHVEGLGLAAVDRYDRAPKGSPENVPPWDPRWRP